MGSPTRCGATFSAPFFHIPNPSSWETRGTESIGVQRDICHKCAGGTIHTAPLPTSGSSMGNLRAIPHGADMAGTSIIQKIWDATLFETNRKGKFSNAGF
jgi:hypothetical protein